MWHRRFDEWSVRVSALIGRLAGVSKPRDSPASVTQLAAVATRGNKLIALSISLLFVVYRRTAAESSLLQHRRRRLRCSAVSQVMRVILP
jgi:hypothetical protein